MPIISCRSEKLTTKDQRRTTVFPALKDKLIKCRTPGASHEEFSAGRNLLCRRATDSRPGRRRLALPSSPGEGLRAEARFELRSKWRECRLSRDRGRRNSHFPRRSRAGGDQPHLDHHCQRRSPSSESIGSPHVLGPRGYAERRKSN